MPFFIFYIFLIFFSHSESLFFFFLKVVERKKERILDLVLNKSGWQEIRKGVRRSYDQKWREKSRRVGKREERKRRTFRKVRKNDSDEKKN